MVLFTRKKHSHSNWTLFPYTGIIQKVEVHSVDAPSVSELLP